MRISTKPLTRVFAGMIALLGLIGSTSAVELRLAHWLPPQHHLHRNIWEPLAEDVADRTNGEVTLRIYPAGQLGSGPNEQFRRAVNRIADITHGLPGYTSSNFPKTLLVELPGVPETAFDATAGLWNAMPLIEDEWRRVKVLALFGTAEAFLMLRDTEVRSPEDLQGLKIRAPSSSVARTLEAWGATPVSMPISEVYNAAQTGVIDGALLDGSTVNSFKLHEVFNNYTVGLPATTSVIFLVMNRDAWNDLSEEHQTVLDELTGMVLSEKSHMSYATEHEKGLATLEELGKPIHELSGDNAEEFYRLSSSVVDERVREMEGQGVGNARLIVDFMGHTP